MNVYFISGLGADRRAFQKLTIPSTYVIHHLDWIPHQPKESLRDYSKRLAEGININEPFCIVGLSFGGIIASEMSEFISPDRIVLISSISTSPELPWYFRIIGTLRLFTLMPLSMLRSTNPIIYWLFGAKTNTDKMLLGQILHEANPRFIKWAIGKILTWKKRIRPMNMVHIHGSKDKILPLRFVRPDVVIANGSHFMVWTKAAEVSREVVNALSNHNYRP